MNKIVKKTLVSGLVALTLAGTLASAPAQAKPFPHPGHGFGGHGFGGRGFGWGAAGLIGGLAIGAIAASSYDCGTVRQAIVDPYGNIVGYRYVPAC